MDKTFDVSIENAEFAAHITIFTFRISRFKYLRQPFIVNSIYLFICTYVIVYSALEYFL